MHASKSQRSSSMGRRNSNRIFQSKICSRLKDISENCLVEIPGIDNPFKPNRKLEDEDGSCTAMQRAVWWQQKGLSAKAAMEKVMDEFPWGWGDDDHQDVCTDCCKNKGVKLFSDNKIYCLPCMKLYLKG